MGAPLATLSTVIKDKSTASIPFGTSLACWLNALSWSAYGFLVIILWYARLLIIYMYCLYILYIVCIIYII